MSNVIPLHLKPKAPKGFKVWQDRKPPFKWRCQHRKTKILIDTAKFPIWGLAFYAECHRIEALIEKGLDAKPGTLGLLISRYRAAAAFKDLAPRTKSDYQRVFDYLQPIADAQLVSFSAPWIVKIRDKAGDKHGRKFGNYVKAVLSLTFAWGLERGYLKSNPALNIKGIRRPKGTADANRPWADAERQIVLASLSPHMQLPMIMMMYCGLDPQDALALPRTAISDGKIDTKRGKTSVPVWMPLPAPVIEAIAAQKAHEAKTLCANSRGEAWTYNGYSTNWHKFKTKLEAEGKLTKGLTLKGLRHTVATILGEMGLHYEDIQNMLGQKTPGMAQHYSKKADRSKKIEKTVKQFDKEMTRRNAKTSNLPEKSVKPQRAAK